MIMLTAREVQIVTTALDCLVRQVTMEGAQGALSGRPEMLRNAAAIVRECAAINDRLSLAQRTASDVAPPDAPASTAAIRETFASIARARAASREQQSRDVVPPYLRKPEGGGS